MLILGLDLSLSAGWSWIEGELTAPESAKILDKGCTKLGKPVDAFGEYPWSYHNAAKAMAVKLIEDTSLFLREFPDVIVIEEINMGKSRWSQKILEHLHFCVLAQLKDTGIPIVYLDSSAWRSALKLTMTKDQKKANAALSKAKKAAAADGIKVDKKALGVAGKVTKKHVALLAMNERFGLDLKMKDDDIADALCLGCAFLAGATPCDGH